MFAFSEKAAFPPSLTHSFPPSRVAHSFYGVKLARQKKQSSVGDSTGGKFGSKKDFRQSGKKGVGIKSASTSSRSTFCPSLFAREEERERNGKRRVGIKKTY